MMPRPKSPSWPAFILLVFVLFLSPLTLTARGDLATRGIPEVFASPIPGDAPVWVSERKAFDETGAYHLKLFDDSFPYMDWVQNLSRSQVGDCYDVGPTYVQYAFALPFDNLRQLGRDAPRLLHGVVVAEEGGFMGGTPGTLLRVRRSNELAKAELGSDFFFFVHLGEVRAGQRKLCMEDPTLPPLPKIGDEILVFARDHESDIGPFVMATVQEAFITIHDGQAFIPQRLAGEQDHPRRTKADVFAILEEARP